MAFMNPPGLTVKQSLPDNLPNIWREYFFGSSVKNSVVAQNPVITNASDSKITLVSSDSNAPVVFSINPSSQCFIQLDSSQSNNLEPNIDHGSGNQTEEVKKDCWNFR